MTGARRRFTGVVAAVTCLVLALTACVPSVGASAPTRTPVTAGAPVELVDYYGQAVSWEPCTDASFDCADIRVPRDYADPDAGDLQIAIIRHRAGSGQALGSLLTNPGGPGVSGVDSVRRSIATIAGQPLQQAYDVIGFDPRGVGASTAVNCYDGAEMDDFLFGIPDAERGTAAWEGEVEADQSAYAAACEANSGGILPYISSANAARDMDVLRAVLGDEKLNYLGYSYGTYLGALYADMYPERVGRMVLDGALDPALPGDEISVGQSVGFENSLTTFLADCVQLADCPYAGTVDNARADLEALLQRLDQRPLTAADGRELGTDSMITAIITALYSPSTWSFLRLAIASVEDGDATAAFTLADAYWARSGGQYADNSSEAFNAYNCMDYPAGSNPQTDALEARLEAEAPLSFEYRFGPDPCEQWPYEPTGVREPVSAPGAAPILVVGTTGDPATPYEWSVSLAAQLSGVLVTRVGEGHLGYNQGDACVDGAVEAYLVDGTVPAEDVRCG